MSDIKKNIKNILIVVFVVLDILAIICIVLTVRDILNRNISNTHSIDDIITEEIVPTVEVGKEEENEIVETPIPTISIEDDNFTLIGDMVDNTQYSVILNSLAGDNNFAYSPESLNSALYMYGLCLKDSKEKEDIFSACHHRSYLSYRSTDSYKLVNRVWFDINKADEGLFNFSVVPAVQQVTYGIDMNDPSATQIKNDFVNEQTNGFIKSTPTEFTPDTAYDFMNIAYFSAKWDSDLNKMEVINPNFKFYNIKGQYDEVKGVGFTSARNYYETDDAYACVLYYHTEDKANPMFDNKPLYRMIVILPKEPSYDGINFVRRPNPLNPSASVDINQFLPNEDGEITAPVSYVDEFNFVMPEIDLNCAFDTKMMDEKTMSLMGIPDFSKVKFNDEIYANANPSDDYLVQVVRIKSDETGTTAAAVTEITQKNSIMMESEKTRFDFICDRPFIYVIYDDVNHDVAFVGQYCSGAKEQEIK